MTQLAATALRAVFFFEAANESSLCAEPCKAGSRFHGAVPAFCAA
ncbi:hypothetical protein [Mitsuokella jalaludinii]